MGVAVCLSIDQGEMLGEHRGVEAGGRKGRGSDDESSGAQLPKNKASVRKEMDLEECHSAAEADLPMARKERRCEATDMLVANGTKEVENAEVNSKYQDRAKGQRPRNFIRPVSAEIDEDQHSSANPELVTSELKQYSGSEVDYSTIVAESIDGNDPDHHPSHPLSVLCPSACPTNPLRQASLPVSDPLQAPSASQMLPPRSPPSLPPSEQPLRGRRQLSGEPSAVLPL
ncbi:hypothetical protein GW17_00037112 [Ensete ventricosum]|nr:hypothetical protein GW17_00037112 [Ensete ventricosum]